VNEEAIGRAWFALPQKIIIIIIIINAIDGKLQTNLHIGLIYIYFFTNIFKTQQGCLA
jgi:hypothetical protein